MNDEKMLLDMIRAFKSSRNRQYMLWGEKYYLGEHDILKRKRTVIGEGGEVMEVSNLPNNKIVDNQYARLVDQKVNYLLGKPVLFRGTSKRAKEYLKKIITPKLQRLLQRVLKNTMNGGISYIYVYYNQKGDISFKEFKSTEIMPIWSDMRHNKLLSGVHLYSIYDKEGRKHEMLDIYSQKGLRCAEIKGGHLEYSKMRKRGLLFDYDIGGFMPYINYGERGYNWEKLPLLPIKINDDEKPLILNVKSLQDSLNIMRSDFMNVMQEDCRNTILVIKNYDGTDLGEFRRNLAQFGAVKVRSADGMAGGIDTLKVEINSTNYQVVCDMLKKALIENGRGFDSRDERFSANPNQMSILTMYSDIDLDADEQEAQLREVMGEILWFLACDSGYKEILDTEIVFNRSMPINESEIIENCVASEGILSEETVIAHHPWCNEI